MNRAPRISSLSNFYLVIFVITVFAGYAGRVITFSGREWPMPQGTVLSCLVGAINGYLISGSLWYYQHIYGYPLSSIGWIDTDLIADCRRAGTLSAPEHHAVAVAVGHPDRDPAADAGARMRGGCADARAEFPLSQGMPARARRHGGFSAA